MSTGHKINFIVISEAISHNNVDGNRKISIHSPTLVFKAPFIPTQISYSISIGLSGFLSEEKNIPFLVTIKTPAGEEIKQVNEMLDIPEFKRTATIIAGFDIRNMVVREEGRYTVNVTVGDVEDEQYFEVYQGDDADAG